MSFPRATPRGRGTAINPDNRFAPTRSEAYDDGWEQDVPPTRATEVRLETAKSVLTRNQSPDVWALAVLTLYSSGSDPLALEVLTHPFQ